MCTKQQSVLNPFRTKKSLVHGSDPSQSTPQGNPKQERETQDSAEPATAVRGADTAAATPSSAAAPITPAPNGEQDAEMTPCTAAAGCTDPQHLESDQLETPGDQDQVDGSNCNNAADHQGAGASIAAVDKKDAAVTKQSRAKGALAAAMSRSGPKKSNTVKIDSEFVRSATAATAAAAASSAARGAADNNSPTPATVSGSRLKLRSPGKPPILLAGSCTAADAPGSSTAADSRPNVVLSVEDSPEKQGAGQSCQGQTAGASPRDEAQVDTAPASGVQATRVAQPPANAVGQSSAQENVPPHVTDQCGAPTAQADADVLVHSTVYKDKAGKLGSILEDEVLELSPDSQQQTDVDVAMSPNLHAPASRATERNGSEPTSQGGRAQPKRPAAALHGRVSVEHVDMTDVQDKEDHDDVSMLEDITDDGQCETGSAPRPKRGVQCLIDSPEASPIKQQRKSARTCCEPDPDQPSNTTANLGTVKAADAAIPVAKPVDVVDAGEGSRDAPVSVDHTDAVPEAGTMQAQVGSVVPVEPNDRDVPEWELAQEIAASNHIAALDGTAVPTSADAAPSATDAQDVVEVDTTGAVADASQHLPEGERWRVEGGRVRARVDVAGMRDRRLAAVERRLGTVSQKLKESTLSGYKAASLQVRSIAMSNLLQ